MRNALSADGIGMRYWGHVSELERNTAMRTPPNSPGAGRDGGDPNANQPDRVVDEQGRTWVREGGTPSTPASREPDGTHGSYIGHDGDAGYGSDEPTQAYDVRSAHDEGSRDDQGDRSGRRDRDRSGTAAVAAGGGAAAQGSSDSDRDSSRGADAAAGGGAAGVATTGKPAREEVVRREKEEFGGMKFGSAFFGWLCAMGMTVLLTALVAGAGAALGLGADVDPAQAADEATQNADTIGIAGAIAVAVILLISYYAGGYVAGRMARFSGVKQGIAVWLWAIIVAVIIAIITAIAGAQWNILANVNTFPRLPFSEGELTTAGIITAVVALLVSLVGAILGGIVGMRYHRKVDRVGFGA